MFEEYQEVGYFSLEKYTVNYTFITTSDNKNGVYNFKAVFNVDLDAAGVSNIKKHTGCYIRKVFNNIHEVTYTYNDMPTFDSAKNIKKGLIHKFANILTGVSDAV